jgi:hypothetical protein
MRYWAYMNEEVPGSYSAEELAALPGVSMTTLVCPAEGEIAEKNWRRAGEFGDIAAAVSARERREPPPAPVAAAAAAAAGSGISDVDSMIDSASTKLFSHVADLMKELENRRDDKSLITSLQRQIAALKEELTQTRERSNLLEMRLPRIAELEETVRKQAAALSSLENGQAAREQALNEARIAAEKNKNDAEAAKRRSQEAANDLVVRNRLVDKLSKDLSEKELSLAKSLGVIRRLEEDLNRLCPDPALMASLKASPAPTKLRTVEAPSPYAPETPEPPELTGPAIPPAPEPHPSAPPQAAAPATFTDDEPPPTPPYLEAMPPSERPKAQQALINFVKKIFPGQSH